MLLKYFHEITLISTVAEEGYDRCVVVTRVTEKITQKAGNKQVLDAQHEGTRKGVLARHADATGEDSRP